MKLMITGPAGHGKDTFSLLLRNAGKDDSTPLFRNSVSSSDFAATHVVWPAHNQKVGEWANHQFDNFQDFLASRKTLRSLWFDTIAAYNYPDPCALGRAIFSQFDIYTGCRNVKEFLALKHSGIFDISVWVEALGRVKPEPSSSLTILPWMADEFIDNNGSLEDLEWNAKRFHQYLRSLHP